MQQALLIALGGAVGALARYALACAAAQASSTAFPWGTWAANLTGCFLVGLAMPWLLGTHVRLYALVVIGFLGAFTTFSAFSFESIALITNGRIGLALVNTVGAVVAGIGFVWLGLALARMLGAPPLPSLGH